MRSILQMACASLLTAVLLVLVWLAYTANLSKNKAGSSSRDIGPTLEQIQLLSQLTTLKVDVADAMETELRGYTGQIKAVVIVRGDVTVGVNLSEARFELIDAPAHRAVLVLSQPQVEEARLDQERTKLLAVWPSGLWTIVPGGGDADTAAINDCYRDAQRAVANAAGDGRIMEQARRQAEQVLSTFFTAIDWTVEVRWGD